MPVNFVSRPASTTRSSPAFWPRLQVEDLGRGDLMKVDCTASHHIALLTLEALLRVGLPAAAKGFSTLKGRLRGRRCDVVTYL